MLNTAFELMMLTQITELKHLFNALKMGFQ